MSRMMEICKLSVEIEEKKILQEISLSIGKGEIHAIMGPNGSGKSTLARVLAGHPSYTSVEGEVFFKGKDLLKLLPEERAHLGLFVAFQYPLEISGVSNFDFLFSAVKALRKAKGEKPLSDKEFSQLLKEKMASLELKEEFKRRALNEGFSGGEKKRNELLQMALLNPDLAVLDEIDSGLDIDALKVVSKGILAQKDKEKSLLLITHYQRILNYIHPNFVHVLLGGKIVRSGDASLALELEEKGYDWLE